MKRKLLLCLGLVLSAGLLKAQWRNQGASWIYNFSSGTNNTVSATASNSTYLSTDPSPVLPAPPSGTSMIFFSGGTAASATIDATGNKLDFVPSVTGNIGKFGVYSIADATAIAYSKFTLTFGRVAATAPATNTTYVWSIGNRGATSNLYSNPTAVYQASGSAQSLFTALRWLYNSSGSNTYVMSYRVGSTGTSQNYVTLSGGTFLESTPYDFEVYTNNTSNEQLYTRNATTYTVQPRSFHVWATNTLTNTTTRPYIGSSVYDLPRAVETVTATGDQSITDDKTLNSFLIQGTANTGGNAKLNISGLEQAYTLSALPVNFISFTGKKSNNGITLSWATASEQNNSHFDILRSSDGISYKSIGTIKGNGNSSEKSQYTLTDTRPVAGMNYYILKQVDFDGTSAVFNEKVAVNYKLDLQNSFSVNAKENVLNVSVGVENATVADFYIYDTNGRKLTATKLKLNSGSHTYAIDATNLAKGVLIAKIITNDGTQSVKFLR
ncbi:T9SS type A sorting domain-containing protein [Pedobacter xixiisoli]|uniref:Por secretion system C-terminal sorting domain-containing protein n=1 Tax=Pedobacter xixiisoli TaxID=1476464 RepID=A0A285ZPA3_9SPHI|nr:T9SS type A sorting domain-containing protein [Pedobacter xixiisoli]SOD11483.1 Por secretion system C-terminal sorting domain-containing protein [Pedobacter xixiisoli]